MLQQFPFVNHNAAVIGQLESRLPSRMGYLLLSLFELLAVQDLEAG